jgi:hypothetical protein
MNTGNGPTDLQRAMPATRKSSFAAALPNCAGSRLVKRKRYRQALLNFMFAS